MILFKRILSSLTAMVMMTTLFGEVNTALYSKKESKSYSQCRRRNTS